MSPREMKFYRIRKQLSHGWADMILEVEDEAHGRSDPIGSAVPPIDPQNSAREKKDCVTEVRPCLQMFILPEGVSEGRQEFDFGREQWMEAVQLLANHERIRDLIRFGHWDKLRPLRDFSLPSQLNQKPELLKRLRRQLAEILCNGLFAQVLESLAKEDNDKVAAAKWRGLAIHQGLICAEGGSLSLGETAHHLQLPEPEVLDFATDHDLVAWEDWKDESRPLRFPKWQFSGRGLLPGLVKVLQTLCLNEWDLMLYFLAKHRSLDGRRPLDLVRRGDLDTVLEHASHYAEGHQGK